jgi:hypothetical protein
MASDNLLLSKLGLQEKMTWTIQQQFLIWQSFKFMFLKNKMEESIILSLQQAKELSQSIFEKAFERWLV